MAQIYQEVIAITISKLVADKEDEPSEMISDELLGDIENGIIDTIEERLSETVVVEVSKIGNE